MLTGTADDNFVLHHPGLLFWVSSARTGVLRFIQMF
jgi:hypothetical protein